MNKGPFDGVFHHPGRNWPPPFLACPLCLGSLACLQTSDLDSRTLSCKSCRRVYPAKQKGVPDFIPYEVLFKLPEPFLGIWNVTQKAAYPEYRDFKPGSVAAIGREGVKEFGDFLADLENQSVLDIGSGIDYLPGYLFGRSFQEYVALDPFPIEKPVPFFRVQSFGEMLPFKDETFDGIILGTSIDHILCLESFLAEAFRVLKPQGAMYLWAAIFTDHRWYKNLPKNRLFQRPAYRTAPITTLSDLDKAEKLFDQLKSPSPQMESHYRSLLVDRFHFRHLPASFFSSLSGQGFTISRFTSFKLRYHEESANIEGFLKLRKSSRDFPHCPEALQQYQISCSMASMRQELYDAKKDLRLHIEVLSRENEQGSGVQLYQEPYTRVLEKFQAFEKHLEDWETRIHELPFHETPRISWFQHFPLSRLRDIWKLGCRFANQISSSMPTTEISFPNLLGIEAWKIAFFFLRGKIRKNSAIHFQHLDCNMSVPPVEAMVISAAVLAFKFLHSSLLTTVARISPPFRMLLKPRNRFRKTMKILHATCSFDLGGTQKQIKNLCLHKSNSPIRHEAIEVFPEQNYLFRTNVRVNQEDYVHGSLLQRSLGYLTLYPSTRSRQIVQILKLYHDFKRLKPDVVVGWGHEMAALTFIAGVFARVPRIFFCIRTFNPEYGWSPLKDFLRHSHEVMNPCVDGIIVNSHPLKQDYAGWLGIDPERISVCHNGIEFFPIAPDEKKRQRTKMRQQLGISPEAIVIANIARFSPEKGHQTIFDANALLRESRTSPGVIFLLVGDGPLQENFQARSIAENHDNIVFLGRTDDTLPILLASDIFVMPSKFEGLPNALMEAMMQGLACVSTDQTGARDIARDNEELLYVPVGNSQHMARALRYLIDHPDERKRLGENARERLKLFSIDTMVQKFNTIVGHMVLRPAFRALEPWVQNGFAGHPQ